MGRFLAVFLTLSFLVSLVSVCAQNEAVVRTSVAGYSDFDSIPTVFDQSTSVSSLAYGSIAAVDFEKSTIVIRQVDASGIESNLNLNLSPGTFISKGEDKSNIYKMVSGEGKLTQSDLKVGDRVRVEYKNDYGTLMAVEIVLK